MPIPPYVVALREKVGADHLLWLPGTTAVVVRDRRVLLVQRADNGWWTPVTGIVDPGEHPAEAAVRETLEETGVTCAVEGLVSVSVSHVVAHANGDVAQYLDHTFRCRWVDGEPFVADDESVDTAWCDVEALPAMPVHMRRRIDDALAWDGGAAHLGDPS